MRYSSLTLYTLALTLSMAAAWAYLTPIDVAIQTSGIVRPDGDSIKVTSEASGRIAEVRLNEGARVHKGDSLLQLDTTDLTLKQRTLETRIHTSETRLQQLRANLEELTAVETQSLTLESAQDETALRLSELTLQQSQQHLAQAGRLFQEGLISRQTYEDAGASVARAEAELAKTIPATDIRKAQSRSRIRDREMEIDGVRADLLNLYHQLEQSHLDVGRLTITSPVDGQISTAASLHPGEFLPAAAAIATIIPEDSPLLIEAWVPSNERQRIHVGQRAQVVSRSQFSVVHGRVKTISPDVRITNLQPAYRITIDSDSSQDWRTGMTFQVYVITGEERLFGLLFSRLRNPH